MASSKQNELKVQRQKVSVVPARTAGPMGINDHSDPNVVARLGDTPGPLGINDYAQPYWLHSSNIGELLQPAALGIPPAISPIGLASTPPFCPMPATKPLPKKDVNWPPSPANLVQPSLERVQTMFGKFAYKAAPDLGADAILITDNWEKENIVKVVIPQLKNIPPYYPKTVRFHRLASQQLVGLWAAWEKDGLLPLVLTYLGSFTPRFMRNKQVLSNHAFGTAFDINVEWNKQGKAGALAGEKGSVRELVPLANDFGFYWGGHYGGGTVDAQHFEVAKIL